MSGPSLVVTYRNGKLDLRRQFPGIHESVLDRRKVVVITFSGEPEREKTFLLNCMIVWLNYTYPSEDDVRLTGDWRANLSRELPKGFFRPSNESGIRLYPKLWTTKKGDDKLGILLMDCSTGIDEVLGTLSSLGAVASLISSVLVHVAKHELDRELADRFQESLNAAIALSAQGRFEGEKMFQKVVFVVTDSVGDWGEFVGQKQLDRFLSKTCKDSTRLFKEYHFSRLFSDIECVCLPKTGVEHLIEEIEFQQLIGVLSEDFTSALEVLAHRIAGPSNLVQKKEGCTPTELLHYLLSSVVKSVNVFKALSESDRADPLVVANAQKIVTNEKILIICGRAYSDRMRRYILKNPGFREWDELTQNHEDSVSTAVELLKMQMRSSHSSLIFGSERYNVLENHLSTRLRALFTKIQELNRAQEDHWKYFRGLRGAVTICITTGLLLTAFSYAVENSLDNHFLALILLFIGKTLLLAGSFYCPRIF